MNNSKGILSLVDYSSDDESSFEEGADLSESKTITPSLRTEASENVHEQCSTLPLPLEISQLFNEKSEESRLDDSYNHGGKIRSFPHERGVWASYVFIHYEAGPEFREMIQELVKLSELQKIHLEVPESFHVSLSRTFKLRHHWILPLTDAFKANLTSFFRFKIMFQSLEVYENEEKTRTFLGLKVHFGYDHLVKLIRKVDMCLREFNLPCFYEDPSFHLSFASCVGSKAEKLDTVLPDLNVIFQSFVDTHPDCRSLIVDKLCCKTGNKLYTVHLKT